MAAFTNGRLFSFSFLLPSLLCFALVDVPPSAGCLLAVVVFWGDFHTFLFFADEENLTVSWMTFLFLLRVSDSDEDSLTEMLSDEESSVVESSSLKISIVGVSFVSSFSVEHSCSKYLFIAFTLKFLTSFVGNFDYS